MKWYDLDYDSFYMLHSVSFFITRWFPTCQAACYHWFRGRWMVWTDYFVSIVKVEENQRRTLSVSSSQLPINWARFWHTNFLFVHHCVHSLGSSQVGSDSGFGSSFEDRWVSRELSKESKNHVRNQGGVVEQTLKPCVAVGLFVLLRLPCSDHVPIRYLLNPWVMQL